MTNHSLLKSSTIMAVGTIVSRITGLVRGLLLVAVLGTTLLGDTFNVANTMPNILYNLIIGGALTAVFVPQIVRATSDEDGGSAFISRLVTATFVFLAGLVLVAILLAPVLVRIFALLLATNTFHGLVCATWPSCKCKRKIWSHDVGPGFK